MSSLDNNQVMMLLLELRKLGIIDSKILEALTTVTRNYQSKEISNKGQSFPLQSIDFDEIFKEALTTLQKEYG